MTECLGEYWSFLSIAEIKRKKQSEGGKGPFGLYFQVTDHHLGKPGQELEAETMEKYFWAHY